MRIAFLSAEYPPAPGGIGDYTQTLGLALLERGHEVFVFTIADCSLQIVDLSRNLQSAICYLQSSRWDWQCWPAVISALDAVRPDLLHIQYQTGAYAMHPAINLLPWRLRGLIGRPRLVVTAHDLLEPYLFPKAGPVRRHVTQRLLSDSDAAIVTNESDAQAVERSNVRAFERQAKDNRQPTTGNRQQTTDNRQPTTGNGPRTTLVPIGSNIAVAPPDGYDHAAWRAQLGIRANETLVAYFGLLGRSKGVDVLVEALAQLPPTVRLLIIGGEATAPQDRAYAEAVRARIAALGLGARVAITGQVGESVVSAHLLAADLAALPFTNGASFRRGSLLAALAHGLPVVTTGSVRAFERSSVGSEGPQLRDGENVILVPPGDVAALTGAIGRLAADTALRDRLGAAGRTLAAQFSWERIAEQHEELYRTLMQPQINADSYV